MWLYSSINVYHSCTIKDSSLHNAENGHQPPEEPRIEQIPVEATSSNDSNFLQNYFSPLIMPSNTPIHPEEASLVNSDVSCFFLLTAYQCSHSPRSSRTIGTLK